MSRDLLPVESALSGEPLLGPRQAHLVDALTHRLACSCGGPMNEHDVATWRWLATILGLQVAP